MFTKIPFLSQFQSIDLFLFSIFEFVYIAYMKKKKKVMYFFTVFKSDNNIERW